MTLELVTRDGNRLQFEHLTSGAVPRPVPLTLVGSNAGKAVVLSGISGKVFFHTWEAATVRAISNPSNAVFANWDGTFLRIASGKQRALNVAWSRYKPGNAVVFYKKHGRKNEQFILNEDQTLSPRAAPHLFVGFGGATSAAGARWTEHPNIDMCGQGDAEIIQDWRKKHGIEGLKRICEQKGYSAISVGSFGHAALKKFDYQLEPGHCKPSKGYSNTLYILHRDGTAAMGGNSPAASSVAGGLVAGSAAVAPASDGWGPYEPILAVTGKSDKTGPELIPGKLATSKNQAFYSYGGREHRATSYLRVTGRILPKGKKPGPGSEVGFQTHCPNTPWYGGHFIGIAKVNSKAWGPGKVKDGTMWYGYGGKEHSTREFHYVEVTAVEGGYPRSGHPLSSAMVARGDHGGVTPAAGARWTEHPNIDMCGQGDAEIIQNWRKKHGIEGLKRICEQKGYSAISVGSFGHAALKKFDYQLEPGHCKPSKGYSNTLYILHRDGTAAAAPSKSVGVGGATPNLSKSVSVVHGTIKPASSGLVLSARDDASDNYEFEWLAADGRPFPMVLKSHPGRALVIADSRQGWLGVMIGDVDEAVQVTYDGRHILLARDPTMAMDCLDQHFGIGTPVVFRPRSNHASQHFAANDSGSVSPANKPGVVLGGALRDKLPCSSCGTLNFSGVRYCNGCGHQLMGVMARVSGVFKRNSQKLSKTDQLADMVLCSECGAKNLGDAVYCLACGKAMDGSSPCQRCNNANPPDHSYCTKCGYYLAGPPGYGNIPQPQPSPDYSQPAVPSAPPAYTITISPPQSGYDSPPYYQK